MACSDLLRKLKYVLKAEFRCPDPGQDLCFDALRLVEQCCGVASRVGQQDAKEQRVVSLIVFRKTVHDPDDIRG